MKTTLIDLLHAMNVLEEDLDIMVDGIETFPVYTPIFFTPKGLSQFRMALSAPVKLTYNGLFHSRVFVIENDQDVSIEAWRLLSALTGHCDDDKFDKWFRGDNAKMI